MDKSFALASLMASLASFADATQCSSTPVEWTNAVNVIGSPGTLTKSAGGTGDWNAGAISTREFLGSAGEQHVSFKCSSGEHMFVGFGNDDTGTSKADIAFGVSCGDGNLKVRRLWPHRATVLLTWCSVVSARFTKTAPRRVTSGRGRRPT